ncbi:hypothetical protein [Algibacter sp. L4_22]|uniref:hypothetical protein n=1 Tax=Algibacter sp. L4_22 TaxID=2942477 RepID=UPI00201B8FDD|nr:hypothetical protein [Algibacter sp. L4_22]MCL5127024.1 hypothetical protein [Algibacter sp. L4_22]
MKNAIIISKKIVLLTAFCATLLSNAKTSYTTLEKKDIIKTALTINNVKAGNLLSIKDENGITLYKEFIEESGIYRKGFDLTALPNGNYFFEVDKDVEIKTIPFTVNSNEVFFNKEEEVTVFKPFVRKQNDVVYITKLAPNLSTLKIEIYANHNGEFELLHTDSIENSIVIEKAYKLEKGSYKILLSSDEKEYTEFIN